ncbi:hypothetical protein N9L68_04265, partial [bacterium]|nr:hypothetical protein [bacterium]
MIDKTAARNQTPANIQQSAQGSNSSSAIILRIQKAYRVSECDRQNSSTQANISKHPAVRTGQQQQQPHQFRHPEGLPRVRLKGEQSPSIG